MPFEGAIVAIAQVIVAILNYAGKHRETMSEDNRNRFDKVQIDSLEMWHGVLKFVLGRTDK